MNTRTYIALACVALSSWVYSAHAADEISQALQTAQEKYQESQALGFAWRATGLAVQEAQAALAAGDTTAARVAAERAIALADASIAQAHKEAEAWRSRMPFSKQE